MHGCLLRHHDLAYVKLTPLSKKILMLSVLVTPSNFVEVEGNVCEASHVAQKSKIINIRGRKVGNFKRRDSNRYSQERKNRFGPPLRAGFV
jgi:hypothetical protein